MLLLAIDIGNTHTVFALYHTTDQDHCQFIGLQRVITTSLHSADDCIPILNHILAKYNYCAADVTATLVASVVPAVLVHLVQAAQGYFARNAVVLNDILHRFMVVHVLEPSRVGIDRLLNVYGAWHMVRAPVLVIDAGTAITFDIGDQQGAFVGGVIAAGCATMSNGLHQQTACLPVVPMPSHAPALIGVDTVSALQSGIFYGTIGLIEGILHRLRGQLPPETCVFLTGGFMPVLRPHISAVHDYPDDLTLRAMVYFYHAYARG